MVTEAQKRATARYEAAHYDKVLIRFEKGTKDRIKAISSGSINAYIIKAVLDRLAADERKKNQPEADHSFLPDGITEENPFQ